MKTTTKPEPSVKQNAGSLQRMVRPRRGQFYKGIEWFACWLLDNVECETIYEERLRPWAIQAWKEHLKRANDQAQRPALGTTNRKQNELE